jgi:hypothetical protein
VVPDNELERPPLLPRWFAAVVVVFAIIGVLATISWVVRFAFGVAKGIFFVALVLVVIAAVRAVARRR